MIRIGGMARLLAASLMLLCFSCGPAFAQSQANDYGIALGPGETLVSVDGVAVSSATNVSSVSTCRNGKCSPVRAALNAVLPGDLATRPVGVIDSTGFDLAPGEILVAIDGVPVSNNRGLVGSVLSLPVRAVQGVTQGVVSRFEVMADARAYAHAKREAEIQASRGRYGHVLGTAPGLRGSGVGVSDSVDDPSHCTIRGARLVARAAAIGRDGRVYWSAHYR